MARGKGKGAKFEREACVTLSLWWTEGEDDDCFWRTAGSGGRATRRGSIGKKARGQCGDISATDDEGKPLTDLITFELKCGYGGQSGCTVLDAIDKPPHWNGEQRFEKWIAQAKLSAKNAGTPYWMLIQKRDMREPFCFFPNNLMSILNTLGCELRKFACPMMKCWLTDGEVIYGVSLKDWTDYVSKADIRKVLKHSCCLTEE